MPRVRTTGLIKKRSSKREVDTKTVESTKDLFKKKLIAAKNNEYAGSSDDEVYDTLPGVEDDVKTEKKQPKHSEATQQDTVATQPHSLKELLRETLAEYMSSKEAESEKRKKEALTQKQKLAEERQKQKEKRKQEALAQKQSELAELKKLLIDRNITELNEKKQSELKYKRLANGLKFTSANQ